jgi:Tfp pilus assembly protein PilF
MDATDIDFIPLVKSRAQALLDEGKRLAGAGKREEAVATLRDALQSDPALAEAHYVIGTELLSAMKAHEALPHLRDAVRLRPTHMESLCNLGHALRHSSDMAGAISVFKSAVALEPSLPETHTNLGNAYYEDGNLKAAVEEHEKAIRLQPGNAKSHFNLALALLASGHWDRGWIEYEWRCTALKDPSNNLDVPQPQWTGWDPSGATLLVLCEQGLGDTLQFIRYVPLLAESGAKIVVESQPPLKELLRSVRGVGRVLVRGEPMPPFDAYVKLMSIPAILGTRIHSVPIEVPYIRVDPVREAKWGARLVSSDFKIGINWAGSGLLQVGAQRSLPLLAFKALAEVPGVHLFSLQKHTGIDEMAGVDFDVETFDPPLDHGENAAFLDTAAVIRHMDLVISCDTSVAHLAGALGARTWIVLPASSDWRWMRDRDDSPWYPTVKFFRQKPSESWDAVFSGIAATLQDLVEHSLQTEVPPKPIHAPMSPGELLDRMAILQIKTRRIFDQRKLRTVRAELDALTLVREANVLHEAEVDRLAVELRRVNEELWHIEDSIRAYDAAGDFGPAFVTLARRVYKTNDRRADIKRKINSLLGSFIADEKEYTSSQLPGASRGKK